MSWVDIDAALMQAVQSGNFGLPIDLPNNKFDPPTDGSPWLSVSLLPSSTQPVGLGPQGDDEDRGILQVDVNVPVLTGWAVLNQHAEAVRAYFKAGTSFTYNGQSVRVRSCSRSGIRPGDVYATVSISVNWQSFTPR